MEFRKQYRKCPACGCADKTVLHQMKNTMSEEVQQRTGYPAEYMIVVCDNCGMVYTDITIGVENIDAYYSKENMYNSMSTLKSIVYRKSQEMYYSFINGYVDGNSSVLDIGCGNGSFLTFLKNKKFNNLCGIDPSPQSVKVLLENGIDGYIGSVYQCDELEILPVDMVISTGVLEHLLLPQEALRRMSNLMNDNGYMYVCVPAAEKYADALMPVANFFNHEHINHFTENSLIALAESTGLELVESNVSRACDEIEYTINAIFKKNIVFHSVSKYDETGGVATRAFFKNVKLEEAKTADALNKIMDLHRKIVIWGTGNYSSSILQKYPNLREKVLFFIDNNKDRYKEEFYNRRVCSPRILCNPIDRSIKEATVLVCVIQAKEEIAKDIASLKIVNDVVYL